METESAERRSGAGGKPRANDSASALKLQNSARIVNARTLPHGPSPYCSVPMISAMSCTRELTSSVPISTGVGAISACALPAIAISLL